MTSTAIVQQQMAQGNGNAASDAAVAAAAAAAAAAASAGNTSHTSLLQHMTGSATFRGQDNGAGQPEVNVDHQDHVHGKDFFLIFRKIKTSIILFQFIGFPDLDQNLLVSDSSQK